MANKNKVKIKKWKIVVSILVLAVLAVTHLFADKIETMIGFSETLATHQTTKENIENSDYYVSYIDVGQGNSSFVKLPDGKTVFSRSGPCFFPESGGLFHSGAPHLLVRYHYRSWRSGSFYSCAS